MSQSDSGSGHKVTRPVTALVVILIAAALATGGYRFVLNSSDGPAHAQAPEKREATLTSLRVRGSLFHRTRR